MPKQKPALDRIVTELKQGSHEGLPPLKRVRSKCLKEVERSYLAELMRLTGGSMEMAHRLSGLSRSRLYAMLKKYNLSRHE